ncbi:hypothetical protein Fmac_006185 [Flemingia macrophylla]|uniref:Uncharacterized protein n=1 Tax=Flemingia macrophylla TaxID=520843 RepID=A0ABD1NCP0_9FABA
MAEKGHNDCINELTPWLILLVDLKVDYINSYDSTSHINKVAMEGIISEKRTQIETPLHQVVYWSYGTTSHSALGQMGLCNQICRVQQAIPRLSCETVVFD